MPFKDRNATIPMMIPTAIASQPASSSNLEMAGGAFGRFFVISEPSYLFSTP
jgi:hypothetical protein